MRIFGFLTFLGIPFVATFWWVPQIPARFYTHWLLDLLLWVLGIVLFRNSMV